VGAAPLNLGPDTVLCSYAILQTGPGRVYSMWHDPFGNTESNNPYYYATQPGLYWVTVTDSNGCVASDSVTFTAPLNRPPANLGNDTTVCTGHTVTLHTAASYLHYTWQDGTHNSTYTAWLPGVYWVTVNDGCTISTDSIHIYWNDALPLDLGNDTMVCPGGFPFTLSAPAGYDYLWQDGSSAANFTVNGPGTFWVNVVTTNGCMSRDTVDVSVCTGADENAAAAFMIYPNPAGDFITVDPGSPGAQPVTADIFDPLGRNVFHAFYPAVSSALSIDVSSLAEGVYIIRFSNSKTTYRVPMVISRH
ncbi:MAG TPA: T9SS type A sorting domain-containing protein, partial [Bacteroidia bacterium]|nr:T9SS type A sorting domain-containing protein [Bacteroidia bacterium]